MAANASDQYPSFDLSGKRALVTGATKGIGRHAALSLAHAGADLFLTGRDADELAGLAAEVRAMGRRAETAQADLAEVAAARRLGTAALETMGGIDVLVNNAGIARIEPFLDTTVDAWDETLDVNLRAPFFLAQIVARAMIAAGRGGKIINMASQACPLGPEGPGADGESEAGVS